MSEALPSVVVGSGLAGLAAALELSRSGPVVVLTGAAPTDANTTWAQGGIAAALGTGDSPEQHLHDTIAAGAGLVDEEAAAVLCREGPAAIRALQAYGTRFDTRGEGLSLGQEAAHSSPRIVHADGDRTGAAVEHALIAAALSRGVEIRAYQRVTRLLVDDGAVRGVVVRSGRTAVESVVESGAVVLATGGAGQIYSHTTNPEVALGEGVMLAFEAGAEVVDLEFFQFHPTALRLPGVRPFLISEAIRGEGAILRTTTGEPFMRRYHPLAELAPRDIVARAIAAEMRAAGSEHVLLDCTGISQVDIAVRFPGIFAFCAAEGLDIRTTPIPVAPAAHYYMGGVRTDIDGRTTVRGLFAAGEVACTGVHGANRLASNSLLEAAVFGTRVAHAISDGKPCPAAPANATTPVLPVRSTTMSLGDLQRLLWRSAGIVREATEMRAALAALESSVESAPRDDNGAGVAAGRVAGLGWLLLNAAVTREESRGAHYRTDFPNRDDDHWRIRQVYRNAE